MDLRLDDRPPKRNCDTVPVVMGSPIVPISGLLPLKLLLAAGLLLVVLALLGMAGIVTGPLFFAFFAAHILLLLGANITSIKDIPALVGKLPPQFSLVAALVVAFFLSWIALFTVLPVTARDALIHHLAVPAWWLRDGQLLAYATHTVSFYPMLISIPYLALLGLGLPPEVSALYNYLYLLPFGYTVMALVHELRGRLSLPKVEYGLAALCGGLLTVTTPIVMRLGSEPLVDLPLMVFCGCGLVFLLTGSGAWSGVVWSGIALGLALSTKPNALPFVGLTLLCVPLMRVPLRKIFAVGVAALIVASPWYLRNLLIAGNPLYPLGAGGAAASLTSLESRTLLYGESMWQIALTPITMLFGGADEDPRRFDGVLTPLLLFALVPLFLWRKNRVVLWLVLTSAAYFLVAQLMSGARIRYLAPILPALLALSALGIGWLQSNFARSRVALIALLVFQCGWAGSYLVQRSERLSVFSYLLGNESQEQYLSRMLPEYTLLQSLKGSLPTDARVYNVLTGNRFFYMPFRPSSAGYLSGPEFLAWVEQGTAIEELHRRGMQYLLINERLWRKLSQASSQQSASLAARTVAPLGELFTLITTEGDFSLYQLPAEQTTNN